MQKHGTISRGSRQRCLLWMTAKSWITFWTSVTAVVLPYCSPYSSSFYWQFSASQEATLRIWPFVFLGRNFGDVILNYRLYRALWRRPLDRHTVGRPDSGLFRTPFLLFTLCPPKYIWVGQNFQEDIVVCNTVFRVTMSCCIVKIFAIVAILRNRSMRFSALKFSGKNAQNLELSCKLRIIFLARERRSFRRPHHVGHFPPILGRMFRDSFRLSSINSNSFTTCTAQFVVMLPIGSILIFRILNPYINVLQCPAISGSWPTKSMAPQLIPTCPRPTVNLQTDASFK